MCAIQGTRPGVLVDGSDTLAHSAFLSNIFTPVQDLPRQVHGVLDCVDRCGKSNRSVRYREGQRRKWECY